jgi:lipopolysaccharide heptosyltransferase I
VIDLGQMGDVVLSLPALAALRKRFAGSRISVMTGKIAGQVVELAAVADEVIAIDRVGLRDGPKLTSILKIFGIVSDVRRRAFDLVIDLHSLPETNILAFLSGANYRLLANRESRSIDRLSNYRPRPAAEDKAKHLADRYLDVLEPLGIMAAEREFVFAPSASAASELGDSSLRYVGLFPGAGHPNRCWPLENFVALSSLLSEHDYTPVVFLGPEEAGMRDQVVAMFGPHVPVVNGLSIGGFIASSARLAVFVTNDTGPMHLAACAGTPIVLVIDDRAPRTYLPLAKKLRVASGGTIDNVAVADVFVAVLSVCE